MATETQVKDAYARALDYVRAQVTPNDGGYVESAVQALRDLATDATFQAKYNEKFQTYQAQQEAATQAQAQAHAAAAQ